MLEIEKLNQYYGESHTLWDMDLSIPKGACVCVMGRNGVGKTTLLKSIMGGLKVKSGSIRFANEDLTLSAPEPARRRGIGFVPQGREIFAQLTVEENLRTGSRRVPTRKRTFRRGSSSCFRCSRPCSIAAAVTCRAASSSSWHSAARWLSTRSF
jgi:urea transport system ATP-binding protein